MIERDSKTCPHCDRELAISAFNRSRAMPDGHAGWCAECMVAVNRAWRAANPAYVAAYNTARRAAYVRRSQTARTIAALAR
jgi:hypothetical protein